MNNLTPKADMSSLPVLTWALLASTVAGAPSRVCMMGITSCITPVCSQKLLVCTQHCCASDLTATRRVVLPQSIQYSARMHAPQGLIKLVQSLHIPLHLAMKHISCSQCASALRFTIVDPAADALAGGKGTQGRLAEHTLSGETDIFLQTSTGGR